MALWTTGWHCPSKWMTGCVCRDAALGTYPGKFLRSCTRKQVRWSEQRACVATSRSHPMAVTTDAYTVWHAPRKEDYMAVKRNELPLHKTIWVRPGARLQIFHDWYDINIAGPLPDSSNSHRSAVSYQLTVSYQETPRCSKRRKKHTTNIVSFYLSKFRNKKLSLFLWKA